MCFSEVVPGHGSGNASCLHVRVAINVKPVHYHIVLCIVELCFGLWVEFSEITLAPL